MIGNAISPMFRGGGGAQPTPIGNIISNDFSSGSWATVGSPNVSFASDGITFGIKSTTLREGIYYKTYSDLDQQKLSITATINADDPDFMIGFLSRQSLGNFSIGYQVRFLPSNLLLYLTTGNETSSYSFTFINNIVDSGIQCKSGDSITLTFDANKDNFNFTFQRNGGTIIPFTVNNNFTVLGNLDRQNINTILLMNVAASMKFTGITFSTTQLKNIKRLCVGDSITMGDYAQGINRRFGIQIGAEINAGGAETTQDVLNKMPQILSMKPKKIYLLIGLNDKANSVPDATWQANYTSIVNQFVAAGITVVKLLYAGYGATGTVVNSWITSNYASSYIDTASPLNTSPGVINAAYQTGGGGGDHPNGAGNDLIATTIMASPLY